MERERFEFFEGMDDISLAILLGIINTRIEDNFSPVDRANAELIEAELDRRVQSSP